MNSRETMLTDAGKFFLHIAFEKDQKNLLLYASSHLRNSSRHIGLIFFSFLWHVRVISLKRFTRREKLTSEKESTLFINDLKDDLAHFICF
jgi:hypothetical protein